MINTMIYQTYIPPLPLSQFIEFFWIKKGNNFSAVQTRLLPMGTMELVINLHENKFPLFDRQSRLQCDCVNGIMLCGTHSKNFIICDDRKISVMGVHFRPGGGDAFFDLPAGEFYNKIISLDELWKNRTAELRDRLLQASTTTTRFRILEKFLIQMLRFSDPHPAIDFALEQFRQPQIPPVRTIAEKTGFSSRYFNQLFRDRVGITPKLFCRIQRLQQVLNLLLGNSQIDWMEIVFTCGYFDQSHLIHDFRSFADCTPTEYLTQRGFHPCHVLLTD